MPDEGSQPAPPPEPTPEPQAAAPVAAEPVIETTSPEVVAAPVETESASATDSQTVAEQPSAEEVREVTPSTTAELPTGRAPQTHNSEESPPKSAAAASPLPPPQPSAPHQSSGQHMREVVQKRKLDRLEEIVDMAKGKKVIVNADVREALKVSDPTATRYLEELVEAGRLKRTGVRAGTKYEPA